MKITGLDYLIHNKHTMKKVIDILRLPYYTVIVRKIKNTDRRNVS